MRRLWQHWNRSEASQVHIFVKKKIASSIQKADTIFFLLVLNKLDGCFQFLYFCDTEQMCSGLRSSLASTYHFHINESHCWINKLMVKMTTATWPKQHNRNAQTHICAKMSEGFLRARVYNSVSSISHCKYRKCKLKMSDLKDSFKYIKKQTKWNSLTLNFQLEMLIFIGANEVRWKESNILIPTELKGHKLVDPSVKYSNTVQSKKGHFSHN